MRGTLVYSKKCVAPEQILSNLYRIEIRLPGSPLKTVNSYVVIGEGRFLVMDTGMNRDECLLQMLSDLERLDVDLKETDFFITHFHADHLGLVGRLTADTSTVYLIQKEAHMINSESSERAGWLQKLCSVYLSNGMPEKELKKAVQSHPGRQYGLKRRLDFCLVEEGDMIQIGGYSFRCIETQGHHEARVNEIIAALEDGEKTAFHIAANITWDIDYSSWELFPVLQKWFAMGETLAHLEFLEGRTMVKKRTDKGVIVFSLDKEGFG